MATNSAHLRIKINFGKATCALTKVIRHGQNLARYTWALLHSSNDSPRFI